MKWSTVSLQKVFFEWLSQLILWHLLLYVLGGGSACTESKILHTPYLIHFGFWTSCQDANKHVGPMALLSCEHRQGKEEGNNQLEHMARSNECSHKTHIIILRAIIIQGDCFNIYNMP